MEGAYVVARGSLEQVRLRGKGAEERGVPVEVVTALLAHLQGVVQCHARRRAYYEAHGGGQVACGVLFQAECNGVLRESVACADSRYFHAQGRRNHVAGASAALFVVTAAGSVRVAPRVALPCGAELRVVAEVAEHVVRVDYGAARAGPHRSRAGVRAAVLGGERQLQVEHNPPPACYASHRGVGVVVHVYVGGVFRGLGVVAVRLDNHRRAAVRHKQGGAVAARRGYAELPVEVVAVVEHEFLAFYVRGRAVRAVAPAVAVVAPAGREANASEEHCRVQRLEE